VEIDPHTYDSLSVIEQDSFQHPDELLGHGELREVPGGLDHPPPPPPTARCMYRATASGATALRAHAPRRRAARRGRRRWARRAGHGARRPVLQHEMVIKCSIQNKLINQKCHLSLQATSKEFDNTPMVDLGEDRYLIYELIYFFLHCNLGLLNGYNMLI
jgi:hypothetical protein